MTDEYGRKLYRLIDNNNALRPVAYCKIHRGYLTIKLVKVHRCMQRNCKGFCKIDCKYWDDKKKRKAAIRLKRKRRQNESI